MRFGDETEFRYEDSGLGEFAAATLIDGIVDAPQERVGRLARIPAQRRTARFDEWGIFGERRVVAALRDLECEPRNGRLSDARRAVQNHVLRIRRRDLGEERADRRFLADDLGERTRSE